MIGVYQILNKENGKSYIGSTMDLKKRWSQHRSRLRCGKHQNSFLQNSWNKYGEDRFLLCVLEECKVDALVEREQHYINFLKPEYNILKRVDRYIPNSPLLSQGESKLIVRWLRSEKDFSNDSFPLDRFYKMSTEDIVKVIKKETNEDISQLELLEATGRVVV